MSVPPCRFRAVLFDLDGTLVDSYHAITLSTNHVRAGHGLAPLTDTEVRKFVGRGVYYLLENTVPAGDLEAHVAAYRAHHPSVIADHTVLLPGAEAMLARLTTSGFRLGVCSNKPVAFTREVLAHLGVAGSFGVVLGPEDVPQPKPAPDMLAVALECLAVPAGEALYVGDMTIDIETARAMPGVAVWAVPSGLHDTDTLRAAGPDRIIGDLTELADRLTAG